MAETADEIFVVGTARTYSSVDTTEAMALQQAPVTSVLAQIDNLPGVLVTEGDTFGFDDWSTGVALRGFQSNLGEQQVGITIDGLPNGGSNYGGGAKANRFIDTQNLAGVEVSQGTADIASRSNEALGGTLNFVTADPLDDRRVRVSASLGDFDAQRVYGRFDSGLLGDDATKFWISISSQTATDHINQSAENRRDHIAAKLMTQIAGIDLTAYASYDDTQEDNYQRLFSEADYEFDRRDDQLTAEWTGIPYIDQLYRKGWSTLRENSLIYVKADKGFDMGLNLSGAVYRHDNDGRGDWVPPYLVNVTVDAGPESELGGNTVFGGPFLGQIFFVDAAGNALSPATGCESSITYPYGGAGPEYDPACHAAGAIPVQSYRHTHYQKERTGITADFDLATEFGAINNLLRGGIWYEDATRYEYRDWHKIRDTRVGFEFDSTAYWVQYNRDFPQTTFKWYIEDVVEVGDFAFRFGVKQFNNDIERVDNFNPTDPAGNFTLESESDVLLSGGVSYAPSAMPGLEFFAGYAENYKAIADGILEVIDPAAGIPDPETAENIEVGARYENDRFRTALTYFDTSFENRLFPAPNETVNGIDYLEASNGGFINAGGIESQGLEFFIDARLTDTLSGYVSYTYIDAEILGTGDTNLDGAAGIFPGAPVPGIAENLAVVSLDYTGDRFYSGISSKFVDEREIYLFDPADPNATRWTADSSFVTDFYAGVSGDALSDALGDVDFRVTVNNVFDEEYLSGISGQGAWIGAPRTVVFTVTADF